MLARVSLAALALLALPIIAAAQTAPPLDAARVESMLRGVESGPSHDEWRALGPEVLPLLARIAESPQHEGWLRQRAIAAAAAFRTPEARRIFRRAMRDEVAVIVCAGIEASARAFGDGARPDMAAALLHRDTLVREAGIRALGSMRTDAARAMLRSHLARERDEALSELTAQMIEAR